MQLNDRNSTNIVTSAVTSLYLDNHVIPTQGQGSTSPSIKLTVGSCQLNLIYNSKETRDLDFESIKQRVFGNI